jgi:hypothetical protein
LRAGALALALSATVHAGCRGCDDVGRNIPARATASSGVPEAPAVPPPRVLMHWVDALPGCDIEHRGLLLDLEPSTVMGRFGWKSGIAQGVAWVEHGGSTWARVSTRTLQLTFTLPEATPIFISARTMGLTSRTAAVSLDDVPFGTLSLQRETVRIASTSTTALPVDPGAHTLTLRFSGRLRSDSDAFADLDWIRIGIPDELPMTYGAPTQKDIVTPAAALSGIPHRAIALRAPGAVRCTLHLAKSTRLRVAVGMLGSGEGDASIRILRDGSKPEVLQSVHVTGGEKATWADIDLPLSAHASSVVALELRADTTPLGGRILFGDPAVVLPPPEPPSVARARAVVLVVLNGVERSELPPWSGAAATHLPVLSDLPFSTTVFHRHRAPATVASAVLASMITGLPPRGHTLTDLGARLPAGKTTIATVARDASIRSAMFTGVPTTFNAFGFRPPWERFVEHPPYSGEPATLPLDEAAAWISEAAKGSTEARLLALIHARGGHPPWDVTAKELSTLAPVDYTGIMEPRRAAQLLAKMRKKRQRPILSPNDRERVRSLKAVALARQDHALGALISTLKAAGLWESTLFVVTGDVSSGASDEALFADGLPLDESALTLPLYVHFPENQYAARQIEQPTEVYDIVQTAYVALGLAPPRQPFGRDLAAVASGIETNLLEPQIATLQDRYSARWGDLILAGRLDARPRLCDLSIDTTCAFDRWQTMPIAAQALFRRMVIKDSATRAPPEVREPATLDPETMAALKVWGAMDD